MALENNSKEAYTVSKILCFCISSLDSATFAQIAYKNKEDASKITVHAVRETP
jgi:hypothetical protein